MKKTSLTRALVIAGGLAVAGIGAAQADAIFYPDGTSIELGPNGADNLALDTSLDTTVLGAGPVSSTTTTVVTPVTQYMYVQPNINWDRSTALSQMHSNAHLMRLCRYLDRTGATASYDVPARAGEASTMTAGVPNAVTTSDRISVGCYTFPSSYVAGDP
jgi:hypothetical protein